jgi:hypothetical protein
MRESVDRVIDPITGLTDLCENNIKRTVRDFFMLTSRHRKWNSDSYWKSWWKEYQNPTVRIDNSSKNEIIKEIDLKELEGIISEVANGKAPGSSGQSYEMFKHCNKKEKGKLLELFNEILKQGKVPHQWKHARIYPIPKIEDWQGQLEKLRPIALIETGKQIFSKILTRRIDQAVTRCGVLQENN